MGVRTTKIAEDGISQLNFFDTAQSQKKRDFEKAIDQIRTRFGVDSVKRASFLNGSAITDHAAGKQKHLNKEQNNYENQNDFL